jgi:hypothetical protein
MSSIERSSGIIASRPQRAPSTHGWEAPIAHGQPVLHSSNSSGDVHPPELGEKFKVIQAAIAREDEGDRAYDAERDGTEAPKRPFYLVHAVMVALAMVLVVVVELSCVASKHSHKHLPLQMLTVDQSSYQKSAWTPATLALHS